MKLRADVRHRVRGGSVRTYRLADCHGATSASRSGEKMFGVSMAALCGPAAELDVTAITRRPLCCARCSNLPLQDAVRAQDPDANLRTDLVTGRISGGLGASDTAALVKAPR